MLIRFAPPNLRRAHGRQGGMRRAQSSGRRHPVRRRTEALAEAWPNRAMLRTQNSLGARSRAVRQRQLARMPSSSGPAEGTG